MKTTAAKYPGTCAIPATMIAATQLNANAHSLPQTVWATHDPYEPFTSACFTWEPKAENHVGAIPLVTLLPANFWS